MKRSKESSLATWLTRSKRKPLVLRGARQVGKSTLVRQFAEKQGLTLHEINLEKHRDLNDLFGTFDVPRILNEIQYICKKGSPQAPGSLLFFDEIQATPQALAALRYFYEEVPDIPVVAAGSLLEFALSKHKFSMPVGRVDYLFLGPMGFSEFLLANHEEALVNLLQNYRLSEAFPETAHHQLVKYLRHYLLVGGMPEAVERWCESYDFSQVMQVHSSILETYQDDFSKYCTDRQLLLVQKVFNRIPLLAGEKLKYSKIDHDVLSRDIKLAVNLLVKAGIITKVSHSDASGIPLSACEDERVYKTFFLDCGLLNRSCRVDRIDLDEMKQIRFINEGNLAEQFICQHLLLMQPEYEKPKLNYWLREKRTTNSEVDFLLQFGREILPLEVKAGKSGSLRSLHQFILAGKGKRALRLDTNSPSQQQVQHQVRDSHGDYRGIDFQLTSLPLYLVEQCRRLLMSD
jgi:predicted AAA+ superfamily ATPase